MRINQPISRLQTVPLRELWPHEALSFTAWVADNLDFISETVGFEISLVEREASAGPFSADILAEDPNGNYVIIENQLDQTDHDHLGKLITYLSNLDAKTAIWITSNPRPEHEKAVHWLNETLPPDTSFYLLQIEAFRIDDSAPAPLLTIIAGPSVESKKVGQQKKDLAQRHVKRLDFWQQLLDRAKERTSLHANISPSKGNWIATGAGKSGLMFSYVIRMNDAQVELYIDTGDAEVNKRIFDAIYERKDEIEDKFGACLDWQRLDDKRASRIRYVLPGVGLQDDESWFELQDRMIETMINFSCALQPEINQLHY
jgi:hypothetical protein